jgi:uncharacterized membrane protein YgaE (UPF0421/DUF939 family)
MAPHQLSLSPLWRNALRLWLAATLSIGILQWSGQSAQLGWALVLAVIFINENDLSPLRSLAEILAAALVGILTGLVVNHIASGWLMIAVGLLVSGALVRALGLLKGLSMGYLMSWAIGTSPAASQFSWTLSAQLGVCVLVGTLSAQVATWLFWPRSPLRQLPALERSLTAQLDDQIAVVQRWLRQGGPSPPSLRSRQLLPQIQQLQQLRGASRSMGASRRKSRLLRRWAQTGDIWRQLLRQWMLLEPLLLQLPAPLAEASSKSLLLLRLEALQNRLNTHGAAAEPLKPPLSAQLWIAEADRLQASRPLLLALAVQCQQLERLLRGRALVRGGIERLLAADP